MRDQIEIIGAVAGLLALAWKLIELLYSHLELEFEIEPSTTPGLHIGTVKVTNQMLIPKRVDYACVVLFPFSSSLEAAIASIDAAVKLKVRRSHPFALLCANRADLDKPLCAAPGVYLIPLPFFDREQQQIGNETLGYSFPIKTREKENEPEVLCARLVIYTSYFQDAYIRWRQSSSIVVHNPKS